MSIVAYGSGPLREFFIATSQFKRGFTKVVVTRAGRLREWSQGELRLYERLLKLTRLRGSPFYPRKISPKQRGLRTQIVVLSGRGLQLLVQCCMHKELYLLFFTCKHDCLIFYYRYQEEIVRLRGLLGNTARGTHARR